ncbi:hypothetical protein ABIE41_003622 [Bosea sp. OAE506]|uniref:hypothetical protein n=1 Tax=Bosea sp. OAE506 TaxID=2663870 RepID=UPI001789B911
MTGSVFTATAKFLRGVGTQATVSVAASALAAAVLALPSGMPLPFFGASAQTETAAARQERWVSPVASDGKIRERHQDAAGSEPPLRASQGLISPAAIVMPMSLDWKLPATEIAVLRQERQERQERSVAAEPRAHLVQAQAAATVQPSPPRRPVIERAVVTAEAIPLQIAPAVQAAAVEGGTPSPSQLRVLGVAMPTPVARVGDAMSGAVGVVGAAGIWTLSRASSLLPRL